MDEIRVKTRNDMYPMRTRVQRGIINKMLGEPRLSRAENLIIDSMHRLSRRQNPGSTPETRTGRKQPYYTAGVQSE
jgi:hypothetical protein